MTTYYHTYYSSSYLIANTNNTGINSDMNDNNLTKWLKNSYNATVGKTTDISELLAQLEHNSGFNPYDSIDNYIPGLENNPLGNAVNDDANADGKLDDNDYYMYTLGNSSASMNHLTSITARGVTEKPAAYSTFDGGVKYYASVADQNTAIQISNNTFAGDEGTTITYYQKSGSTYDVVNLTADKNNSKYINGISIDKADGYISANDAVSASLSTEVDNFITASGKIGTVQISTANKDQLLAMYKQLTSELQGLKEYTLSNQEIQDMQEEIDTLNGDGVKKNFETKIAKAQKELEEVYTYQIKSIKDINSDSSKGIFSDKDISKAISCKISEIGTKFVDAGVTYYSYAGIAPTTDPDYLVDTSIIIPKELFNKDTNGNYDFINNPFYQYEVALRTDKDLEFEKSFNEAIPEWNTDSDKIKKGGSFDPTKYSTIEENNDKLGPVDILKNLYSTQELLALYKQYEDSQNKANSMTLALNTALQTSAEFDFRKVLAEKVLEKLLLVDPLASLELSNEITINKTIERGSSVGPTAQKKAVPSVLPFDGYYGETNTVAKKLATPIGETDTSGKILIDPYTITINGTKYVFGQDADSNGNIDDVSEILGINDSQDNPFASLISLDTNKDGIVSENELSASHIVLKALDSSGKLTTASYDTSLISGIDLSKLDKTSSGSTAGSFLMKLANGMTVKGTQTFDDQAYFNNLFGKLVDLRPYQTTSTASTTDSKTSTTDSTTKTTTSNQTSSTGSISHKTLLQQINNAYSSLIIDDTSNIETVLDNICWKHSVSLTPAQRVRIIDSIDPLTPVYAMEKKIIIAVSNLNLSA